MFLRVSTQQTDIKLLVIYSFCSRINCRIVNISSTKTVAVTQKESIFSTWISFNQVGQWSRGSISFDLKWKKIHMMGHYLFYEQHVTTSSLKDIIHVKLLGTTLPAGISGFIHLKINIEENEHGQSWLQHSMGMQQLSQWPVTCIS